MGRQMYTAYVTPTALKHAQPRDSPGKGVAAADVEDVASPDQGAHGEGPAGVVGGIKAKLANALKRSNPHQA